MNSDFEKLRLPCDKLWYNSQTNLKDLRVNTATRRNTLVQHLGQTARPITIKIGVHLREGTPYGGFLPKILEIQIAFSQNLRFRMLGLGKNTPALTKFGTSLRSNYWAQYNKIGMHHPEGTS